jgi:hypothetical protein
MKLTIALTLLFVCLVVAVSAQYSIDCTTFCAKYTNYLRNRACRIGCEWPKYIGLDDDSYESDKEGTLVYPLSKSYKSIRCMECDKKCLKDGLRSSTHWRNCVYRCAKRSC